MRDYSKVSQSLWTSKRFAPMGRDLRLLYLYLLTCPHGNSIGCFRLPIGYLQEDMRLPKGTCLKQLEHLSDTGLIRVFEPENLVQIDKFLCHNPIANKSHANGATKIALALPDCGVKAIVLNELKNQKWKAEPDLLDEIDTCLARVADGCCTETETETLLDSVPIGTGGTPPESEKPFTAGKAIFDTGKSLLATAEKPPKNPGAVINAWLRDHGEPVVWTAMLQTLKQGTPDPIAYMNGCLRMASTNGKASQAEDAAASIADEILNRPKVAEA